MEYIDSVIKLIKDYHCQVVAEIGVFRGVLAKEVIERCCLQRYYLIDPWRPFGGEGAQSYVEVITQDQWDDMCQQIYVELGVCPEVRIIRLDSIRATRLFEPELRFRPLDMVFIDADHSYEHVKQDIEAWYPLIKKGGIISGHDYGSYQGVIRAVNERFKKPQLLPGWVWYVEKT